ncbi:phage protein NinX family protein [Pseudomonas putida]|uniref:phage protein NinX family protein n=1 Tax=Pseudomonas putida TaxID=303 RepID=UPI00064C5C0A|nr:phage protein NinX family protein [Pseudomonas putida]
MTDLIEVRSSNLVGMALDWAVGIADGRELELPSALRGCKCVVWCDPFVIRREGRPDFHDKTRRHWRPSTEWRDGGPLIDKYQGSVRHDKHLNDGPCRYAGGTGMDAPWSYGPTPLIAFCRSFVLAKLGDTVQVPKELMP